MPPSSRCSPLPSQRSTRRAAESSRLSAARRGRQDGARRLVRGLAPIVAGPACGLRPLHTPSPLAPFLEIADGDRRRARADRVGPPRNLRADGRAAARARRSACGRSWSKISTGRTRRRSMSCASSRGGSNRSRVSSSPPTATTSSTRHHPLRAVLGEFGPGVRARVTRRPALTGGGRSARGRVGNRRGRAVPADERQLVLRHRGAGRRWRRRARDGARRRARARCPPRHRRSAAARRGRRRAAAHRAPSSSTGSSRTRTSRSTNALTAGMLRAGAGRVSFRHELARLAIENTLPPGARRTLHRAVLAALGDVDPHGSHTMRRKRKTSRRFSGSHPRRASALPRSARIVRQLSSTRAHSVTPTTLRRRCAPIGSYGARPRAT